MVKHAPHGYTRTMRFRLGLVTGFAAGYYMGAKAGRQRYEQINRVLARLRRSEAFEQAADRAKTLVEEGVDKARSLVETREGNGHGDGQEYGEYAEAGATDPFPQPPADPGDYSSSR